MNKEINLIDILKVLPKSYIGIPARAKCKELESLVGRYVFLENVAVAEIGSKKWIGKWERSLPYMYSHLYREFKFKDETGHAKGILYGHNPQLVNKMEVAKSFCSPTSMFAWVRRDSYGKVIVTNIKVVEHLEQYQYQYPIYRTAKGVTHYERIKILKRLKVDLSFKQLIPAPLLKKYGMGDALTALKAIHWPSQKSIAERDKAVSKAISDLSYEELISYHLEDVMKLGSLEDKRDKISIEVKSDSFTKLKEQFGFRLTAEQAKAIEEVYEDFRERKTVNRLIIGDVGSGKTVVFIAAILQVALSSWNTILLCPTCILAKQNYDRLNLYLKPFNIPIFFISGGRASKRNKLKLEEISHHKNAVVVTTQVISDERIDSRVGMIVIDEQHKYGLKKREEYVRSMTKQVHILLISATPIPRTLYMSEQGLQDVSTISSKPEGRKNIITKIFSSSRREAICKKLKVLLQREQQIYWICPRIFTSRMSLESLYAQIKLYLIGFEVDYIHGRLADDEKQLKIKKFKDGITRVLVGTTVLEVGIDSPKATIIVVEEANSFGMSTLHQLRGRVGRGSEQSYCILLYEDNLTKLGKRRMEFMREHQEGKQIAIADLKNRGCGNLMGLEQAGRGKCKIAKWEDVPDMLPKVKLISKDIMTSYSEIVPMLIKRWK